MTETELPNTSTEPFRQDPPIVVGIDGSKASMAAFAFAYEEALLRGIELRVVYAWQVPNRWAEAYNPEWPADRAWFRAEADKAANEHVEQFLATKPRPEWLEVFAVEQHPAAALMAKTEGAKMLVVGSRGRGGFTGLLLGSVSSACVQHASCPVVVVRPE